jgi:hypothetical protein
MDRTVGVLSATAPGTLIKMAVNNGYTTDKAMALSLFASKIHGLAVMVASVGAASTGTRASCRD